MTEFHSKLIGLIASLQWLEPSMLALVFDITRMSSFSSLAKWAGEYKALAPGRLIRGPCVAH